MTTDKSYNGWTNYATWRVNLEVFDGFDSDGNPMTADTCRQYVEDMTDEALETGSAVNSILSGWVGSFLSDVDWDEIAKAVNEANGIEPEEED